MDFEEDILSAAFESVENDTKLSKIDKSGIKTIYKTSGNENTIALGNKDLEFANKEEDDIFSLALEDVENKAVTNNESKVRSLVGVDLCFEDTVEDAIAKPNQLNNEVKIEEKSLIHTGDTDSSDDEDNRYFEEARYDSYGKSIKKALQSNDISGTKTGSLLAPSWKNKSVSNNSSFKAPVKSAGNDPKDVSFDPMFGIRIVNPLVSSQTIKQQMYGRTPVTFLKVKSHVTHGDLKADWVIAGVLVRKLPPRVSQNGSTYSMWILSDLKADLKTISLFLFGRAHDDLWKTPSGTVFAILNPTVFSDKKASEFEAKLSIKSSDQVMIWGKSKDLGQCNFKKKNGEICGAFVNVNQCEFCVYHVKQEYKKYNSRSELKLSGTNKVNLRNKVLGKNEVFYGGKSFTAVPVVGKKATNPKDKDRLQGLGFPSSQPKITEEKMQIPNLQRSNEILKMLSQNSSKSSNEKILNNLKGNTTKASEVSNKSVTSKSVLPAPVLGKSKPLLSNPGNEISFDIDFSNTKKPQSVVLNENKPKNTPKNKLQKRFNGLLAISSGKSDNEIKTSLNFLVKDEKKVTHAGSPSPGMKKISSNEIIKTAVKVENEKERKTTSVNIQTNVPSQHLESSVMPKTPNSVSHGTKDCSTILKQVIPPNSDSPKFESPLHKRTPVANVPPNSGMSKAKLKALQYIKNKGPINKENPTGTNPNKGVKRPLSPTKDENEDDKKPVLSERFLQLMNQKSAHEDLVEIKEMEQEMEYFERLEKKDRLEEKMLNTFKVDCKAVTCLKCNYTWFSASEACKAEGHPTKVVDAMKRFFKCGKCDNRTVSLTIIPLIPCKKCFSSNWVRAPMIREKIAKNNGLSIRGGEQKFTNSVVSNGSLNLLVPD